MAKTRKVRRGVHKTYHTHDNGGRPFVVEVRGKVVSVAKNAEGVLPKHLFTKTANEVFIGKKSPRGGYDGLSPAEAEGNSVLVKVGPKYIFIGHEIYEFSPVAGDEIVAYYSDIGNSDSPYPYAVGKTHIYILLNKVAVEKTYFDPKQDVYQQFYFETFAKDCLRGFGNPALCKDRAGVKARLEELHDKTHKLKAKMLVKRSY